MTHTHTHRYCIDILNVAGKGMPVCCNCVRISQLYSRRVCTIQAENGSLGIVWFLTLLPKLWKLIAVSFYCSDFSEYISCCRRNIVYSSPFVKIYELILVELWFFDFNLKENLRVYFRNILKEIFGRMERIVLSWWTFVINLWIFL